MNPQRRSAPPLSSQTFDVLVIGGGITGVAVARECAQRGMRTLVVEQHDFASGTTSRSTRMIHGGLHPLERGEIAHAYECLRERRRMMALAPHLVRPLRFLRAFPRNPLSIHRSSLALRTGLWLSHFWNQGRQIEEDEARAFEMQLDSGQSWSVYSYENAQCEFPERLVAEWLLEAEAAGAIACNHTQVLKITRKSGQVSGARVRDTLTGEESTVAAAWVINAAGPWADRVVQESNLTSDPLAEAVRGSHLVLPTFAGAPQYAVRAETSDGRVTTVIPWNGQILVGTTQIPDSGDPGKAAPDRMEIDFLMRGFTWLFPASGLTKSDIRASYAGIWAPPHGEAGKDMEFCGKHVLHEHGEQGARGLISVVGGNLSRAAAIARDVARLMGLALAKPPSTYALSPSDNAMETALKHRVRLVAFKGKITQSCANDLTEWYGRNALSVAQIASRDDRLREPICSHTAHLLAEAVYAVEQEHAVTLADVVLRRVPVALGPCWSEDCSREAAVKIGSVLGWDPERIAVEFEELEQERENFLHPRRTSSPMITVAPITTTAAEAA